MSQRGNEASTNQLSNKQGTDIVKHPYEFTGNLYNELEEDDDIPKHSNKSLCDSYVMPSCETTRTDNFEKEDMLDAHNLDQKNPCIINDHDENYDHKDELNIVETVSDPIDIAPELTVKVEVEGELTTNMELKQILNESVEGQIHFLAVAEKVPAEKVDEFDPFSSEKSNKAQGIKTSRDMEGGKLEAIIP
ncbi:hypothetical protein J1N35_041332 [Gossypium stocksii]|uniref:Uncharacterized protein n=1 Tax=Gossypium stocksii TaxID=47602 RepID=A0A9D3UFA2_9ROSI|nr:hypothetical protein J1N35_041332 [Gossypium stocksii]